MPQSPVRAAATNQARSREVDHGAAVYAGTTLVEQRKLKRQPLPIARSRRECRVSRGIGGMRKKPAHTS
jgi:hypothetical protein